SERLALHDPFAGPDPCASGTAGHEDPRPAQRRGRIDHLCVRSPDTYRRGRPLGRVARDPVRSGGDGTDRTPATCPGAAPARGAGDRGGIARRRRLQHQPRFGRVDHRHAAAWPAVHSGQQRRLPDADRAWSHLLHRSRPRARLRDPGSSGGRESLASGGEMIIAASNGLPGLHRVAVWFNDPGNWHGQSGLLARLDQHVVYSLVLVLAAVALALPLGLLIGHTGRGVTLLAGAANGLRAIPSLGLLLFLIVLISPRVHVTSGFTSLIARGSVPYLIPATMVLLIVAIPPILTSTYTGVQSVEQDGRDAARGAGMTPLQVMTKVELPCALPLIMSGVRNTTLQVIATLTVAAYAPLVGGLGRLIVDGDQNLTDLRYGYPAMVAAAITIAALALVADALLVLVQRSIVSPGISGRYAPSGLLRRPPIHIPLH